MSPGRPVFPSNNWTCASPNLPATCERSAAESPPKLRTEFLREVRGQEVPKMDEQIIQDIVAEVFSSLEPLDAQSAAILQFLKAKGLATDEELAPFLAQAGNAANVRWLAARVRLASLLTSALKTPEKPAKPPNEEKRDDKEKEKKQEGNSDQTLKADSEKQGRQENLQAQDQGAAEKKQVNDKAKKQEQPQNSRQSPSEGRGENAAQSSLEQSNSSAASSKKD